MSDSNQAKNAWRILFLLFLANLFNFYDRALPAIIIEPIRKEWSLSDLQIGLIGTAFTIIYAIVSLPLGRMADNGSRKKVMGWGLVVWSSLTALNGLAGSFITFLLIRIGVGVGEAAYTPAANSLIGDLFPPQRRARAMGVFMLGLPLGLVLAYFTTGLIVAHFGSWRAPFFIAAVPGLMLALFMFMVREPQRGAAEAVKTSQAPIERPIRRVLAVPTFVWLVMAGLAFNFATYALNTFMVPMFQRYFLLPLQEAALATGSIVGVTGLIGLTLGGWLTDKVHQRHPNARLVVGAVSTLVATLCTSWALLAGRADIGLFIGIFSLGWLFSYSFYTSVYTAILDVVEPRLRATAMALYMVGLYLLGGGLGPIVVGALSDHLAKAALLASGGTEMTDAIKGVGLHDAMYLIPVALACTVGFLLIASRSYGRDVARMREGMLNGASASTPSVEPAGVTGNLKAV